VALHAGSAHVLHMVQGSTQVHRAVGARSSKGRELWQHRQEPGPAVSCRQGPLEQHAKLGSSQASAHSMLAGHSSYTRHRLSSHSVDIRSSNY